MASNSNRLNLHDELKRHTFHHGLITTYTFGSRFFEDYALEKFAALRENGNLSVILDEGIFRQLLNSKNASRDDFPHKANLRYLLHPIQVRGRFHPKINLFTRRDRGLLVIGSANFSRDGVCSNAELVATFEYVRGESEEALPLFQQAFEYFTELSARWPSSQLTSNLNAMLSETQWLSEPTTPSSKGIPKLIHNLDLPLFDQILEFGQGEPIVELDAVSRFFDDTPRILDTIMEKASELKRLGLYTQNGITTLTESWLNHSLRETGHLEVRLCRYEDEEHSQPLHGKALALHRKSGITLAVGSANFTTPALFRNVKAGNAEVMLIYDHLNSVDFNPRTFFDPCGKGILLEDSSGLRTAEKRDEVEDTGDTFDIRLSEVLLSDDTLNLSVSAKLPDDVKYLCELSSPTRRAQSLEALPVSDVTLTVTIPPKMLSQMKGDSTVAQLIIFEGEVEFARSCPALVTDIQDLKTGRNVKHERRFKEAKQSPQHFLAVLLDLSASEDETALLQFLTHLNVPLDQNLKAFRFRPQNSRDANPEKFADLKALGPRNIQNFLNVHEAVIGFVGRHFRRLNKHLEQGTAAGIPNFFQIMLTVGQLLRSEIRKAIAGLDCDGGLKFTPNEWHAVRDQLDDYFKELRALLNLGGEYLETMFSTYDPDDVKSAFEGDVEEIQSIYDEILSLREEIVGACESNVRIAGTGGKIIVPQFFRSILISQRWKDYSGGIKVLKTTFDDRLAG